MKQTLQRPARAGSATTHNPRRSVRCAALAVCGLLAAISCAAASAGRSEPPGKAALAPAARFLGAPLEEGTGPICKGYRILQPGTIVRNGQVLEFYSIWDSADYEVRADLSAVDATATQPIPGTYVGDESVVEGDSLHAWPAYRFERTISSDNPLGDASGLVVPITARNLASGDSATSEALQFCLSNGPPPEHLQSTIAGDARRFVERNGETLFLVRNGDSIRVETSWTYGVGPFGITADFSALDDSASVRRVYYGGISEEGRADYWFWYELSDNAHAGSEYPLPLLIVGFDGGCGRDSVTLGFEMDNQGPIEEPTLQPLPAVVTDDQLIVSGLVYDQDAEDVLLLVNGAGFHVAEVHTAYDSLFFADTLSLSAGTNTIVAYARDLVGNRSPASTGASVELQDVPLFKRFTVVEPETVACHSDSVLAVANGDLIHFYAFWDDRAEYTVTANFADLDSQGSEAHPATRRPDLDRVVAVGDSSETWTCYEFADTISTGNLLDDGDEIAVPVTALDHITQNSATSKTLLFCLRNHPPEHLWTQLLGDSARFVERNGQTLFLVRNCGTINIQTSWRSNYRSQFDVAADLSSADEDFLEHLVRYSVIDSLTSDSVGTYGISYTFSLQACCGEGIDHYPILVPIRVRDANCGCGSYTISLEMDNQGPDSSAYFVPLPLGSVGESSMTVSGFAPGAHDVLLLVTHQEADSTTQLVALPSAEGAFAASVPLLSGSNLLQAFARDVVGNRAPGSTEHQIYLVDQTALEIPKPFRTGDEFILVNPAGWNALEVEIYNLEGDRVWSRSYADGPFYSRNVQWDGRNAAGQTVRQGPYLLRVAMTATTGNKRTEVRAFVYQR